MAWVFHTGVFVLFGVFLSGPGTLGDVTACGFARSQSVCEAELWARGEWLGDEVDGVSWRNRRRGFGVCVCVLRKSAESLCVCVCISTGISALEAAVRGRGTERENCLDPDSAFR